MSDPFKELQEKTEKHFSKKATSRLVSAHSSPVLSSHKTVSDPKVIPNFPKVAPNPYEEKYHSEFSFMSFVLGVFGLVLPLFSVLAVIFGIAGLMQTHRERMKGRWMAYVGILLGFLGVVLVLIAIVFNVSFLQDYLLKYGAVESFVGNLNELAN